MLDKIRPIRILLFGEKCQKQSLFECGWYFTSPSRATCRLSCGRPFSFLTSPENFRHPHKHHLSLNRGCFSHFLYTPQSFVPPTQIFIFICVTSKNLSFVCVTFEIFRSFVTPEYVCITFVNVASNLKRFDK